MCQRKGLPWEIQRPEYADGLLKWMNRQASDEVTFKPKKVPWSLS